MKKTILFALGALLSINAWSFDNVPATFQWVVGNEAAATVTSDAADGVNETKVKTGSGITVAGTKSDYAVNNGNTMVQYQPAESNKGVDPSVMIEYSVKMKKGVTFSLTEISYDALKDGTDNAKYSWSFAVDGVESAVTEVPAEELLRNNGNNAETAQLNHTHAITAAAGQVVALRIYVSGFANNKKFALSNVLLKGTINGEEEKRAFTDFKIDFRSEEPTIVLPEGGPLPSNVSFADLKYKDAQHGLQGGTITVQVDGPVKFTLGGCGYGNNIAVKKNGADFATIDNKVGCDNSGVGNGYTKFATWLYNVEEAAELSFTVNGFLPYFFAEACEFVPQVEVRYYDTDGKKLIGSEIIEGSSALKYKYGVADITVPAGCAFRGWFDGSASTALKVAEGTAVNEDLSLYAHATEIEEAALGKIFNYDFRPKSFYPEDHEVLVLNGGSYKDTQHGWVFKSGNTLGVKVAGNALIVVGVCKYSHTGDTELRDEAGNVIGKLTTVNNETPDGELQSIMYYGEPTTLTFHFSATDYIHSLKVYNITSLPEKDLMGYYEIAPNDGAGLILTLEMMAEGEKIFLPNGTYDLGETCLTTVSKNNISIIGESMEKTIIKNTPDFHKEGISTTATLLITATNTYLQDLTLWNNMDYFAALAATNNGRAVCLQDKGTQTICKNVRMLSNQDTYYSNKVGGLKYFEDCEIHGTVDFICGDGSVYFKNNVLVGEQRNASGGGANAITASNADASDKGYVFESCRVKYSENIAGTLPVMSFGRSWNNAPKCVFLNTVLDDSNGTLNFYKDASAPKDQIKRWHVGAMNKLPEKLGEFNSVDNAGNVVSPTSNNITFVLGNDEKPMETILSANDAATYTMGYTLGAWANTAAADATQIRKNVFFNDGVLSWNASEVGLYLVYIHSVPYCFTTETSLDVTKVDLSYIKDLYEYYFGNRDLEYTADYYVRFINARGGFGPAVRPGDNPEAIDHTVAETQKVQKIIRDGQVVIVRDNKEFNLLGTEIR